MLLFVQRRLDQPGRRGEDQVDRLLLHFADRRPLLAVEVLRELSGLLLGLTVSPRQDVGSALLGVALRFFDDRRHLVAGLGQHLPMLGHQLLGLFLRPPGLVERLADGPLPLLEHREQRFPRDQPQHDEQGGEGHDRPKDQPRLYRYEIHPPIPT